MGNAQRKHHSAKGAYVPATPGSVKKVHWDGPGLPAPPGKPILIPGEEDAQPDVVCIRWERSPSNGGSAIIGYYVEHRKLGSPSWERSAPVLCTYPELTLSGLEPGWRYQFRIRAQNAMGLSEPSELSDPLTVTLQRTTSILPRFDVELKDCVALEAKQVELTVYFSGIPIPKITWFKDGFEIICSRRIDIKTDCSKSVLVIYRTMVDDEGEIKCSATNRAGHISTRAKLTIEVPAYVRLPSKYDEGLLFEQGDEIKLKAIHGGRPPPSITWYHNGEIIVADDRRRFEFTTENETILVIGNSERSDRGEYSIRVINRHGENVASFLVTVIDRPAPPGKVMITRTLGRSVTLSWTEPEDDGGSKVGTYLVEYHRMGWDMWLKSTTCRQTTVTLNDLIEGSQYEFRVKAENLYGLSEPSQKSDVVFIPDPKRGITEPNMRMKSVSHRDIPRGRSERREVSFHEPATRTRSLTREEASNREAMAVYERSNSSQRLLRSSRADSRVTFALDTTSRDKDQPRRQWSKELLPQPGELEILGNGTSSQTAIVITPSFDDSGGQYSYPNSRARSVSYSREHSPSPLVLEESMEVAIKETVESMNFRSSLSPPPVVPRRRRSSTDTSLHNLIRQNEDEDMLHGSSEFMLVLYPGEENRKQYESERLEKQSEIARREARNMIGSLNNRILERQATVETTEEEEEDLIPPPMSLSLPELFSVEHQVIETMREAVSSTELLHERAMERFYKAIEAEQSAEQIRAKTQSPDGKPSQPYPLFKTRTHPVRRRPSSGSSTSAAVRQLLRDRRRSSEGEAKMTLLKPPQPPVAPLQNVSSDPNLRTSDEKLGQKAEPWHVGGGSPERLRRWHEPGIDLSNEESLAALIDKENKQNNKKEELLKIPESKTTELPKEKVPEIYDEVASNVGEILAEDSIETSGLSSEAESTDSEDLRQLKARIMAIPVLEEEDTYHPRGRMILHMEQDIPPPVPPHRVPLLDIPSSLPDRTNLSPTNSSPTSPNGSTMPKSILKKRTETDPIPVNQFGRPIPPEKPIRKSLQAYDDSSVTLSNRSLSSQDFPNNTPTTEVNTQSSTPLETSVFTPTTTSIPAFTSTSTLSPVSSPLESTTTLTTTTMSVSTSKNITDTDSDKEAVISAGEAAVSKRRQMRQGSKTLSTEESEEEHEEKMAVVSHYTEIVRQYSHPDFRQRSLSRDRDQKRYESPSQTRVASPVPNQINQTPKKEKLPVTPGKIIEPIPPIVPLMAVNNIAPAKIITPIPPVVPTTPIQKAQPILPSERHSRRGSLSSRANESDSDVSVTRGRSREPKSTNGTVVRRRKNSVGDSRSSTPTRRRSSSRTTRNESRPSSRNESPMPRSRNVSRDRGSVAGSRSSSKTRESRPVSGIRTKNSRPSSRASSRDRSRAGTPSDLQIERLQRALDDKKYRVRRMSSKNGEKVKEEDGNVKNSISTIETERKVRTTMSYVTDVCLLLAALYLYLFKKEVLAIPILALLLYRYIQQEISGWIPSWFKHEKRS